MDKAAFFLTFACLLTHEMDAVRQQEWRMLPGLSRIGDESTAYRWFTGLHVPIYALLLWAITASHGDGPNGTAALLIELFAVVHAILHIALYRHRENRFREPLSYTLIVGAGIFGAAGILVR